VIGEGFNGNLTDQIWFNVECLTGGDWGGFQR
jgi:hypothetical protein